MTRAALVATGLLLAVPVLSAAGSGPPRNTAIRWEQSFSAAKTRAAREGKPVLLLHLFGRLDEDLC